VSCENFDRLRQLVGRFVYHHRGAEFGKRGEGQRVEARNRLALERKLPLGTLAGRYPQHMIDEIEGDFEIAPAIGDG
jgi:hypothetical protein